MLLSALQLLDGNLQQLSPNAFLHKKDQKKKERQHSALILALVFMSFWIIYDRSKPLLRCQVERR